MLTVASLVVTFSLQVSGWEIFSNTKFEWRYMKDMGMNAEIPIFDDKVKAMEGKEVTLTGYYLPVEIEGSRIILSKMPYASCFFCGGGGGLESVAEIQFDKKPRRFKMDQILTIKGKLKLNESEYGHLVFILTNAEVKK